MTEPIRFNADNALKLVADDWGTLRECDVYRLFDSVHEDNWPALFDKVVMTASDRLRGAAYGALAELVQERWPIACIDEPNDAPGYALCVAVHEATGLTRSDAQGVAELEIRGLITR